VTTRTGSVRVTPAGAETSPIPQVIFAYKPRGITVSYAGVPTLSSTGLRSYVESSGTFGSPGSIQSGIAIANNGSTPVHVTLELTRFDGAATGLTTTVDLPAFGHSAKFLSEFFTNANLGAFQGVLRISASTPVAVVGLRGRYNELGDFLITTTTPADETAAPSGEEMLFPQLADGGGYITQFILFGATPGQQSQGILWFVNPNGQNMNISVH
jgi:hypothetical protein